MRGLIITALTLAGCTPNYPGADIAISEQAQAADFPTLAPLSSLVATAQIPSDTRTPSDIDTQSAALDARVARLKQRAAALRGRDIFDGQERLKLLRAPQR